MFTNVSMTGVGGVITIIELALQFFNVQVPAGSVGGAVNGVVAAFGLLWLIWGQLRRPDLSGGLIRK